MTRIFLCHAHEDKPQVNDVYQRLRALGWQPWMDKIDLLPGQQWQNEIPRALRASDFILIFFSRNSVVQRKRYVQREFKLALDTLQEIPSGMIHTIPIRLDDCAIPTEFEFLQRCDFFEEDGFARLEQAIREGLSQRQRLEPRVPVEEPVGSKAIVHETSNMSKPRAQPQQETIKPLAQPLLTKADATSQTTAQAGDKEKARKLYITALEIARSIQDTKWRARALSSIATAQVQAGDKLKACELLAIALETARSIQDKQERAGALSSIARAQAQAGDFPAALETARSLQDATWRAGALHTVIETILKLGLK